MTNPVPPPTESGWYVVEWNDEYDTLKGVFYIHSQPGFDFVYAECESGPEQWDDFGTVTRYTGPLDLEKLLDDGG